MCRWKIICRCSYLASLQPYTLLGRLWVTNGLWSQQQALLLPQLRCFSWKKQKKAELNVERWSHKETDFSSLWQKNWINDREAMWIRWPVPIIGPGEAWLTICSLWCTGNTGDWQTQLQSYLHAGGYDKWTVISNDLQFCSRIQSPTIFQTY